MSYNADPHVSEALVKLRGWVTLAGGVVAACVLLQVLIFGFAHYTDIRVFDLKPADEKRVSEELTVVTSGEEVSVRVDPEKLRAGRIMTDESRAEAVHAAIDVNRVLTPTGVVMRNASGLSSAVGSIAALLLVGLTAIAVCVAGGAQVPGIGKTVSACVWSFVVIGLALPWDRVFAVVPINGVLGAHDHMVEQSTLANAGSTGSALLLFQYALLPVAVGAVALLVVFAFRSGVDRGIIVQAVSDFDAAIDKEIANLKQKGVSGNAPRTVGALNRAIGDKAATPAAEPADPLNGRSIKQRTAGDGLSRPI